MSNSTGVMLIKGIQSILTKIKSVNFLKETGPKFVEGLRSGWSRKTKKGAQHRQSLIGKSAVGLYSQAHGVHWRKK